MSAPFAGWVLAHAAAAEGLPPARAGDRPLLQLGVGKTAAAVELYAALTLLERSGRAAQGVLLYGVAGAFPDRHRAVPAPVAPGGVAVVASDRFGDEGVEAPDGFHDLARLGLGDIGPFVAHPRCAGAAAARLGAPLVDGVTVSCCSGTEAGSQRLHRRSGADVETMEGAAVALVCRRLELPLLHVRAISNWTGDRDRGGWDLGRAVAAVHTAVCELLSG